MQLGRCPPPPVSSSSQHDQTETLAKGSGHGRPRLCAAPGHLSCVGCTSYTSRQKSSVTSDHAPHPVLHLQRSAIPVRIRRYPTRRRGLAPVRPGNLSARDLELSINNAPVFRWADVTWRNTAFSGDRSSVPHVSFRKPQPDNQHVFPRGNARKRQRGPLGKRSLARPRIPLSWQVARLADFKTQPERRNQPRARSECRTLCRRHPR